MGKAKHKLPFKVSQRSVRRVKNPLPFPKSCDCCSSKSVKIVSHDEVYGRKCGDWPWLYLCSDCGAYVGMHPNTSIPLGFLADSATRSARSSCKGAFIVLYKHLGMSRSDAYQALADELNIPVAKCHWGWFDVELCYAAKNAALRIQSKIKGRNNRQGAGTRKPAPVTNNNKRFFIELRVGRSDHFVPVFESAYSKDRMTFSSANLAHNFVNKSSLRGRDYRVSLF